MDAWYALADRSGERKTSRDGLKTLASHAILTMRGEDLVPAGKEESDVVEFKSYYEKNQNNHTHKEDAIIKTICAFLNSSGGVVIWGAPVGKKEGKKKVFVGDLSPVEYTYEKDDFISKISNRIIPLPANIRFKPLEVEKNKYVYIVEVPQSIAKPHQFDGRYFMRLDGQTKTAPHHYIEALFKQISFPNIGGYIKIEEINMEGDIKVQNGRGFQFSSCRLNLKVIIINQSPLQNGEKISCVLTCNQGSFSLQPNSDSVVETKFSTDRKTLQQKNAVDVLYYGVMYTFNTILDGVNKKELLMIKLYVGGKVIPQKISIYTIDLKKNLKSSNYNEVFVKIDENKTQYDSLLGSGKTIDSIIGGILGR
jgi:hypothetical protein